MTFWRNAADFFWGAESWLPLLMVLLIFGLLHVFLREDRASL